MAESVTKTAASLEYGKSEVELIEQTLVDFPGSALPRVESCKIALSCRLFDSHILGDSDQEVIYGQIQHVFVEDSIVTIDEKRITVDATQLDPLARLGGSQYSLFGEIKVVKRPR